MILSLDYTDRMLQKLWNPFRDWNDFDFATMCIGAGTLQKLWNPFRDWNLGVNTNQTSKRVLQKLWNPFRDWNMELQS